METELERTEMCVGVQYWKIVPYWSRYSSSYMSTNSTCTVPVLGRHVLWPLDCGHESRVMPAVSLPPPPRVRTLSGMLVTYYKLPGTSTVKQLRRSTKRHRYNETEPIKRFVDLIRFVINSPPASSLETCTILSSTVPDSLFSQEAVATRTRQST